MLQRTAVLAALAAGLFGLTTHSGVAQPKASPEDQAKVKAGLQVVQDFIGTWNLEGTQKAGAKTEAWKEKVSWGWKFKDGNPSLVVSFADGKGKYYKDGELNYDAAGKKYVLALNPATGDKQVFEGAFAKGMLTVTRKDKSGDVQRITMNTLSEGEKLKVRVEKQDGGKGPFGDQFVMNGQKEGLAVAGGAKKPECVVSGGAASMPVTYNGKTYYVCCSGCRDEFNADPKKYAK